MDKRLVQTHLALLTYSCDKFGGGGSGGGGGGGGGCGEDDDNAIYYNTFCTFQMEIIVKVRAPTLNNKMRATGTPKTSRSALPFEIQQNASASEMDF